MPKGDISKLYYKFEYLQMALDIPNINAYNIY